MENKNMSQYHETICKKHFIGYIIRIINKYVVIQKIILEGQRASVLKVTEYPTMHCIFYNSDWAYCVILIMHNQRSTACEQYKLNRHFLTFMHKACNYFNHPFILKLLAAIVVKEELQPV